MNKFTYPTSYRFRMADPEFTLPIRRIQHTRLKDLLRLNHTRRQWTGRRNGPNKVGRHFTPLSVEVLRQRLIVGQAAGRVFRGQPA